MTDEYATAVRHRDELRATLVAMDAAHAQRRAQLRASEARAEDRQHEAARAALEADVQYEEARAAALGDLPVLDFVNTRWAENREAGVHDDALRGQYRDGEELRAGQSVAGFTRARGMVPAEHEGLSFGKYLRGVTTGSWAGADAERRAMSEGTPTAGGNLLVPAALAAQVIDKARAATRVMQAGARTVPMPTSMLRYAVVTGDPTLAWHSELAAISPSDPTIGSVLLTARTLAGRVILSRELIEDAVNVDTLVVHLFAAQLAQQIDQACKYGPGAPAPTGIKVNSGVTKTPLATNGASPTWDNLVDAAFRVRAANYEPTAQIMNPRSAQAVGKTKATTGEYLAPPSVLDGVPRLLTTGVPNTLTVGTGTNTSDIFTGDFTQLVVGVRTEMQIALLRERDADIGAFELAAWWRGDVAVLQPSASTSPPGSCRDRPRAGPGRVLRARADALELRGVRLRPGGHTRPGVPAAGPAPDAR